MSNIMKKNILYRAAALGALPLLLAACSQQDNEPVNISSELVPLEVSVGVDTRDIIQGSTLPDLSNFGIFGVTQETGELQEDIENVGVEYVKGECALNRDVLLDERPTSIYAYYPYNETATLNSVPVQMNDGTTDYLYGCSYDLATGTNTTVNNAQPHATIYFKHALAQVRLIAYKTADYEGDAYVAGFVVNGVPLYGTMDVTTGDITDTEWGDMVMKVTGSNNLFVEGEGTTTYRFLAIPTDRIGDRMMLIELDGEYVTVPLPATVWEAGQQYTYTLVVDGAGSIRVGEAVITPWENNEEPGLVIGDENYAVPEAVDLGLSVKWAAWNMGAYTPEGYGDYYYWGDPTGDATANVFTSYPSNISGTDYDIAVAKWGNGWRLPTSSEFYELRDGCTWEWTSLNGVNGYRVTGNNGNSIFLPAAGGYNTVVSNASGYYMSGTYSRTSNVPGIMHLWINADSFSMAISVGETNDLYSVRPVQE